MKNNDHDHYDPPTRWTTTNPRHLDPSGVGKKAKPGWRFYEKEDLSDLEPPPEGWTPRGDNK